MTPKELREAKLAWSFDYKILGNWIDFEDFLLDWPAIQRLNEIYRAVGPSTPGELSWQWVYRRGWGDLEEC